MPSEIKCEERWRGNMERLFVRYSREESREESDVSPVVSTVRPFVVE